MDYFQVTTSTLSAPHLAAFLQEKYRFRAPVSCQLIRCGINHTYLISDLDQKFVFRVYSLNWRTATEILEEIRLLNLLRENEISISYALADRQHNYIQVLPAPEGERLGVLFSYAPGEKLPVYSTETHFHIGALIARLHEVTLNQNIQRITYSPDVLIDEPLIEIAKFLSEGSPEMAFLQSTGQYLHEIFTETDTRKIRHGMVHLDIWFDNLNITEDGQVTIFDFDFCGNGWLCLDLAYYLLQLYNLEKDETECRAKTASFLRGYASITPIPTEERRILRKIGVSIYFFYLGVQCRRFDNWSNVFLNEAYLKRYINLIVKKYLDAWELED